MTREKAIECLNYQNETFFGGQSEALKMAISALSTEGEYIKKEDAIEYLNDLFGEMYHVSFGNVLQSLDSLQTYSFPDSAENKGDLISRQKVLETLEVADTFLDEDRTVEMYKALLTECIKVLPSADVRENIHGHIMETHFSDYELFKCSECGRRFFMQKSYGIYKACPFCMVIFDDGADMRGET